MKLSNLQVVPYGFELTRTLRTARGEMRMRRGFILSAVSHAGHRVHGEVAPLPGLSDESLREAAEVLETIVAGKLLEAKLANDSLDSIATFCAGLSVPPSVRHGVEQLFVDALSQEKGVSVACLLNLDSAHEVETATLVADAKAALRAVDAGFRTVKLKVGYQEAAEDIRHVFKVREAVGEAINIRIDANGAWTPAWAVDILKKLAPANIECIEQPVDAEDVAGLAWVRSQSPIAVAADESARTAPQIMDLLDRQAADWVVLKPMLCGGPALTYALGRMAQARGVKVMITTALDTALGRASALQVAAALAGEGSVPAGLDTGDWLTKDVGVLPKVTNAMMPLPHGSGFGVQVNLESLVGPS